ncbi:potassium-transporting ATPase subunit KdpC [Sanguibacter sp. 25GB23B1]|uniref:potassium-transporting ATPase subunit KdpC n=1 Tax=unclassified Sanguibacter TaxID=2645534 RepID=UPI0032AF1162
MTLHPPTTTPRASGAAHPAGLRRTGVSLVRQTLAGLRVLVVLSLLLGVAYPLVVLGIGQAAFPWQANGSLLRADGTHVTSRDASADGESPVVGSALVAQGFDGDEWFHPRPSAAGDGYDTLASGGSNLGPTSPDLVVTIEERRDTAASTEGTDPGAVPPDALTASASGLDPHISPENAALQTARVAEARGLSEDDVTALVEEHTDGRDLGVLGEPRVNVLELNLALGMMSS